MIKAKYVAMVLGVAAVVGVTYWSKQRLVEPSAYQKKSTVANGKSLVVNL